MYIKWKDWKRKRERGIEKEREKEGDYEQIAIDNIYTISEIHDGSYMLVCADGMKQLKIWSLKCKWGGVER